MQKREAGAADGAEIAAEAELEAGEKAVPHIDPQILPAEANDLRAIRSGGVREKRNDRLRDELNARSNNETDGRGREYSDTTTAFYIEETGSPASNYLLSVVSGNFTEKYRELCR